MTPMRTVRGAISLSTSPHLAAKPYSQRANPVTLPPGRARLATRPLAIGSPTCANTIGKLLAVCFSAIIAASLPAKIASGRIPTSSAAKLRKRSLFPPDLVADRAIELRFGHDHTGSSAGAAVEAGDKVAHRPLAAGIKQLVKLRRVVPPRRRPSGVDLASREAAGEFGPAQRLRVGG